MDQYKIFCLKRLHNLDQRAADDISMARRAMRACAADGMLLTVQAHAANIEILAVARARIQRMIREVEQD